MHFPCSCFKQSGGLGKGKYVEWVPFKGYELAMQVVIKKSGLQGSLRIPPSKSHTLRAILFGALANGKTTVRQFLPSPDAFAMIRACESIGAKFTEQDSTLIIEGTGGRLFPSSNVVDAGNSGIVLRFMTALAALGTTSFVITGDKSITSQRPMKPLLEALCQLGVSARSIADNGFAPVEIQGPIKNGQAIVQGADSQPVSALLIAGAFAKHPLSIEVINPGEKPWVAMTLYWFDRLRIRYKREGFTLFNVYGNSQISAFEYTVPGDFSSAAFPIAAALITRSPLTLYNLDMNDCQGDKEVLSVFSKMGASIEYDAAAESLKVKQGGLLKGIEIDINDFIDAITIIAVVGCFAEGETRITNAAVAKQKECDRIACIVSELKKMGASIESTETGLIVRKSHLKGATVNSYGDHRMVMSLAVAALAAEGETCIRDVTCVSKTYPQFFEDFKKLGADIEVGL